MTNQDFIGQTLHDLKRRNLYRRLTTLDSATGPHVEIDGRTVLQFASNNYLGLAGDERVREAATRAIEKWGWGAGASRLVTGHTEAHEALEADLAAFEGTEAALVFPTGYMTNLGAVSALVGHGDIVLSDRENHASLYDAVRLSGALLERFAHADAGAAADLLAKYLAPSGPERKRAAAGEAQSAPDSREVRHVLLATDTVFSMGGDLAPLADLADACRRRGAMLLVDEAHATGVLGPTGAGLVEQLGHAPPAGAAGSCRDVIIATVGTLSKALGGIGGFVAASREVRELLINKARPFIYTTALPAAACEAARAALRIVREEPERRRRVLDLAERLRGILRARGFDTGSSATPIIPVIVGPPERALEMAARLLDRDIFCPAIRPPTVPPNTSRLRISLTAEHTEDDVERLVEALAEARGACA
jgi:8-amino-7-oxononanoate synthase